MKKHIEKIKQRPLKERKKIATSFAIGFTILIVILWLVLLSIFKSPETKDKQNYDFSPFENLFQKVGDEFENVGDKLEKEKDNFEILSEETKKQLELENPDNVDITEN